MSSSEPTIGAAASRLSTWRIVWGAICVVGVAGWLACAFWWDAAGAWRAMLINFAYFTPMAAGMACWPAVVMASRGRWMGEVQRTAMAGVSFAPVSIVVFLTLWAAAACVEPANCWAAAWIYPPKPLHNAAWLAPNFMFIRDGAGLLILWIMSVVFARRCRGGRASKALAGWLVFAYCIVMSLVAFDMVMALDPHWYSTLFGGYFFISGMYIAVAAWALMAVLWQPGQWHGHLAHESQEHPAPAISGTEHGRDARAIHGQDARATRHDLGKLVVTFSLLTTYMMFSQLMVIWYENLPDEVRFVIPRLRMDEYGWVSAVLLAVIYLGPLVYLLTVWSKKSRAYLAVAAVVVLAGMWVERWWLVAATVSERRPVFSLADPFAAAAMAGLFVLLAGRQFRLDSAVPVREGPVA
ncbi:MAG: hypothetical protein ACE15C_01140 [Phycisphaerae bacterium]